MAEHTVWRMLLFAAPLSIAACGTTETPEPPASTESAVEVPPAPAPVAPAPPAFPAGGATVQVSGHATGMKRWLLLDTDVTAAGAKDCPSDIVLRSDLADIPISIGAPESCQPELSVFAEGTLPVLNAMLAPGWMAGSSVIPEVLPGPHEVLLNVVVVCASDPECASMLTMVATDRSRANDLFDTNKMGITFAIADGIRTISPVADKVTGRIEPLVLTIRERCAAVAADNTLNIPGRLNVFYVNEAEWQNGTTNKSAYGYNCVYESHRDIIFVRQAHVPEVLSHEVGHALLGLAHAGFGKQLHGWSATNLMRGGAFDPTNTNPPDHFSLGQAFHAIFDTQSWLNAGGGRVGSTKECQLASPPGDSKENWPCPRLQLDWDAP